MSLKKLMENKILNEKMKDVYEKEKNKEYSAAYESVRDILDFINKKFIMKIYNIDLKDASTIPASKIYFEKDKRLFEYMLSLNDEYNTINYLDIMPEDVDFLISYLDCIYNYMFDTYGEFM